MQVKYLMRNWRSTNWGQMCVNQSSHLSDVQSTSSPLNLNPHCHICISDVDTVSVWEFERWGYLQKSAGDFQVLRLFTAARRQLLKRSNCCTSFMSYQRSWCWRDRTRGWIGVQWPGSECPCLWWRDISCQTPPDLYSLWEWVWPTIQHPHFLHLAPPRDR